MSDPPNNPASPLVLGMGELLWDVYPDHESPGGAPANVAFHAKQLGLDAIICSRVGDDDRGDRLFHHLETHGVDPRHVQRDVVHETGIVTIDVSDPAAPTFVIREDTAWDHIEWTPELAKIVPKLRVCCFGTLAQRAPTSRETIWRLLEALPAGAIGAYDVNLRPPWYQKDWIQRSFELATIVKYNSAENDVIARLFGLSGDSLEANARALLQRFGIEWVCVTTGREGSVIVTPDETVRSKGSNVTDDARADAVGASDAFTAAVLRAYLAGWPPDAAGDLANAVAALVAGRPGGTPDLREPMHALTGEIAARHGVEP